MKYDYRDQNDNPVIKARSLDETLKEIVSAVNSIGLRMPMDDTEMVASVHRIAEVLEDYRVESVHENEQRMICALKLSQLQLALGCSETELYDLSGIFQFIGV